METKQEVFDTYKGQEIQKFTVTNDHDVSISAITLGATWKAFNIPGKDGQPENVMLSMPSSEEYMKNQYFCQAIGRTAGRITNGTFSIKGKEYHVDANEGTTTLHGGPHGFNTQIWDGSFDGDKIVFTKHIDSSEDSFPGNIDVKITYSLNDDNEVTITYTAKSDADTLFNPTQHAYFNLSDSQNVYGQSLQINADKYLELNKDKTPTGKMVPVDDTAYDFRDPQNIKLGIDDMKLKLATLTMKFTLSMITRKPIQLQPWLIQNQAAALQSNLTGMLWLSSHQMIWMALSSTVALVSLTWELLLKLKAYQIHQITKALAASYYQRVKKRLIQLAIKQPSNFELKQL